MVGLSIAIFLSGISSLTYEISWQLLLSGILGSDAESSTVVVAAFLAGLCVGYFAFGWFLRRKPLSVRSLLLVTGGVELGIAGGGSLFSFGTSLLHEATLTLSEEQRALLFGSLLIFPPTVLMGGTLPLLSQAFSQKQEFWERGHAKLYGANTFGGFLGVLGTAFVFLPYAGGGGAIFIAAFGNVLAAFLLFGLAAREEGKSPIGGEVPSSSPLGDSSPVGLRHVSPFWLPLLASFFVGFSTLSLQVVFFRLGALILGSTYYLFSIILGVYVCWLAVGGFIAVPRKGRLKLSPSTLLFISVFSLSLMGYLLRFGPYMSHLLRIQFALNQNEFPLYLGALFVGVSILLFLPLLSFGAFEPVLVSRLSAVTHGSPGRIVGWCYGTNCAGSVFGVILTGLVFFHYLNLDQIFTLSLAVLFLASFLLLLWEGSGRRGYLCLVLLLGTFAIPRFSSEELGIGLFRLQERTPASDLGAKEFFRASTQNGEVKYVKDGRTTTSVVMEFTDTTPPSRTIFLNGKADGNTVGDRVNMNMIGALASVVSSSDATRVGLLGFGTGMTAGALGRFEKYKDIVVFELDENAPKYAEFFKDASNAITEDPRFSWRLGDALWLIPKEGEVFDVFISQPSNPWVTGMERLYSEEYYETVKQKLRPQGLFVTWFAGSAIGESSVRTLLYTFRRSFQGMRVFQFGRDYILLGWNGGVSKGSQEEVFSGSELREYFESFGFSHPALLFAHELWFIPPQVRKAEIQSLYRPYLSILGARDFFQESEVDLFHHFHTGSKWYYQLLGQKRSLLAELPVDFTHPENSGLLKALLTKGCGGGQVRLQEPLWRTERTLCRDTLVAAVASGMVPVPESLVDSFRWLAEFRAGSAQQSITDWQQELASFALFESIFLRLNPDRLVQRLAGCFDKSSQQYSEECQVAAVRTLSLTGNQKTAWALLERLPTHRKDQGLVEYINLNTALISSN